MIEEDLGAIVELYLKVFGGDRPASPEELRRYFHSIFFQNPWVDKDLPSLVCQEGERIIGFLGVIPRPMLLNGRPIRLAVSNHFMVDPSSRSTLAAVQLLKAFFAGLQDMSLAEAGNDSRKVWEALGGMTSLPHSLYWTRPLRPSRYMLFQFEKRGLSQALAWTLRPICRVFDALAGRLPRSPFRLVREASENVLTETALLECLSRLSSDQFLHPVYDPRTLTWLLDILEQKKSHGMLRRLILHNSQGGIAGWYLYYLKPGGISEVLQIGAERGSMGRVLDHLFYHARKQGAVALTGRLDPKFMEEFDNKYCLIHRGDRAWMLVHTRHPDLLAAIHRDDIFLSRLEGEWWVSFHGG